ncbi:hypothetical protein B0H13DRAFT_1947215 [Mycena leptocephala]|nr:hypothetical protein B0H13DRAFT_1947215 [Mycena leptocephala]
MSDAVERELHALPAYYGESPNSAEAVKPETFFQFIVSFSSDPPLEVHDAHAKRKPPIKNRPIAELLEETASESTVDSVQDSLQLMALTPRGSHGRGRGELDHAIQSMREEKRRARPPRPSSKIFLDGGRPQSRVYD